jgi:ABC-type uncharacterized transport system YnjBCD substrate-binding protein
MRAVPALLLALACSNAWSDDCPQTAKKQLGQWIRENPQRFKAKEPPERDGKPNPAWAKEILDQNDALNAKYRQLIARCRNRT